MENNYSKNRNGCLGIAGCLTIGLAGLVTAGAIGIGALVYNNKLAFTIAPMGHEILRVGNVLPAQEREDLDWILDQYKFLSDDERTQIENGYHDDWASLNDGFFDRGFRLRFTLFGLKNGNNLSSQTTKHYDLIADSCVNLWQYDRLEYGSIQQESPDAISEKDSQDQGKIVAGGE